MTYDLSVSEQISRVGPQVGEESGRGPGIDTRNSLQPEQYVLEMSVA